MKAALRSFNIPVAAILMCVIVICDVNAQTGSCTYDDFIEHLKLREGFRECVYRDSLGKPTVCYGHLVRPGDNLSMGDCVTQERCDQLLRQDAQSAYNAARSQASQTPCQDSCFVNALAAVNYQLGTGWYTKFPNTWNLIKNGQWDEAADALNGTLWQKQTPVRVADFQAVLRAGCGNTPLPPPAEDDDDDDDDDDDSGDDDDTGSGGGDCCSCICGGCVGPEHDYFRDTHSAYEFEEHRRLLIEDMFVGYLLPAMMMMTEQITVIAMQQVQMIGAFLDAKQQLETQQLIQELQAQAHKDYRPSVGLCEFGSAMKSLNASDALSDWTKLVLSQRSMQRQLGTVGVAAQGVAEDTETRLENYRTRHCDPRDLNRALQAFCEPQTSADRFNKDIDYARTVSLKSTLDINFLDNAGGPTPDEEDVFELHSYLFGHDVFVRIPRVYLRDPSNPVDINPIQTLYLDMRSVFAKRSVAENSFVHNVAMRAQGTNTSTPYLVALMDELGIPEEEITRVLGENPSYYAQMRVLTEIINYNPDLYVNLYDTPTNVMRKRVALQAIGILQKWDTLESMWRAEMSAAVAASIRLDEAQEGVQDELNRIDATGISAEEFLGR